ncbi:MAG: IclR family transcriptional regulator [Proteobacteria bacterium]|nr:IclR family transcriptional regulator [Pseudomonadota bacterium]
MQRARHKPRQARPPGPAARDPLFNHSVEKAFAILTAFGNHGQRALGLAELAASVGMTTSSAQRCTHTLVRLGLLRRDPRLKRWLLTPRVLGPACAYLSGHGLLEQATTHLVDLNQASGESVSFSEPSDTDMVYIARFPSLKRFYIHMAVGRRLPMYCTAAGRAYLAALPVTQAQAILRRSEIRALTPQTLTDPRAIMKQLHAAREAGYAWSDQETYRGDVSIAAAVLGEDGEPLAAINVAAPTSRWSLEQLRAKVAPVLLQTARAASAGRMLRPAAGGL